MPKKRSYTRDSKGRFAATGAGGGKKSKNPLKSRKPTMKDFKVDLFSPVHPEDQRRAFGNKVTKAHNLGRYYG